MRSSIRFELCQSLLVCVLSVAVFGCSATVETKAYEDYPEFQEGGSMTLTVEGQPYTVTLESIIFANTDVGYSDYVEIAGRGTRILAEYANKDLNFNLETSYAPLVNTALPLGIKDAPEAMTIELAGLGNYTVTGGSLTLQKFQIGRDGRDWWDGQISITVETTAGTRTISGPFSWCIVPVS